MQTLRGWSGHLEPLLNDRSLQMEASGTESSKNWLLLILKRKRKANKINLKNIQKHKGHGTYHLLKGLFHAKHLQALYATFGVSITITLFHRGTSWGIEEWSRLQVPLVMCVELGWQTGVPFWNLGSSPAQQTVSPFGDLSGWGLSQSVLVYIIMTKLNDV